MILRWCLSWVLAAVVLSGCHARKETSNSLTPTQLRAEPTVFDGKKIVLHAWVTLETEDANLWTDKKDMDSGRTIHCVSLSNYERFLPEKNSLNRRLVEIEGTFRKDVVGDTGEVRFAACSRTAVEPISIRTL